MATFAAIKFGTWAMVAYLTATLIAAFAPPTDMEAMQILPDSSWSATVRNLERMRFHL